MSDDQKTSSPIAEDLSHMQIAIPLPCTRCGYDVQGLTADGDCPECSKPIRLTIFEIVDPLSKRLGSIPNPASVGNSITGAVLFFSCSVLLAVFAMYARSPSLIPVPATLRGVNAPLYVWIASFAGLLAILSFIPLFRLRRQGELQACQRSIELTSVGLLAWTFAMALVAMELQSFQIGALYDTYIPVVASVLVFSGFRRLVPRLGKRSLAFRQAQSSRQRMNVLLATLVVLVVGRVITEGVPYDSVLRVWGLILIVMSVLLIVVGLMYLLKNVIWIRKSLISPPPALSELLRSI